MDNRKHRIARGAEWSFYILILLLYPLRHIHYGVDLMDGGYNYANFQYGGLTHMDDMWYFATWLANEVGSFFTKLPYGDACLGMNVYTGLLVSMISIGAFLFCVKRIQMPAWLAFASQMLALSMCWAPTGVLYNYLTFLFLQAGIIFLYEGLRQGKSAYLIAAGVALGLNVANRFSNLAQTGLILAVWTYGFLNKKKLRDVLRETGFCVLGYVAALGVFLGWMTLKYGLGNYTEGVMRLFQMTEHAEDYTPGRMLLGMVWSYYDGSYFMKRLAIPVAFCLFLCIILPKKWVRVKKTVTIIVMAATVLWLTKNRFYTLDFASFTSVYYPCVTVMTMAHCLALYRILDKKTAMQEKLLGILLILIMLITPLGSNNAIYSAFNNLFLVLPGFLWMVLQFVREKKQIYFYPFKGILLVAILFFVVQGLRFGNGYITEEASGGRNLTAEVEAVPVLAGIKTNPEKAQALTELYRYLQENGLRDKQCIVYGQIPGLAYYMQMPPAMNIWGDLLSYDYKIMEQDLEKLEGRPVILLSDDCAQYVSDRDGTGLFWEETAEEKMKLICSYIEENGYQMTFLNKKFAVFE